MIRKSIRWTGAMLPLALAAQLAGAQAATATLPAAASLVARYATAVGGPAYLSAKSIVTKGAMSMPAAGINAQFQMTQLTPNQMQMVTTIPGMGEVQVGYDGTNAWAMDPMQGPRVLAGGELDQMKDEADRRANVRSAELFTSMQTLKDTTMNAERCYLVKLTWKSGRETYDCYSATSGMLVASRSTQKTAMGEIPVVTLFSDFKKFGGVTVPTKTVQELMGQQQILTIASVEFGDGTGLTITPPPAVAALIVKK
jgi:hypothetical protein